MAQICRRHALFLLGCPLKPEDYLPSRSAPNFSTWTAIYALYATDNSGITPAPVHGDPVVSVPLNLDRLRIGVLVLQDLLQ